MMAGLRDGRTLRTLYVSHAQFKTYCAAHPEHAQEALPLIEANAKSARLRKGAHLGSRTHCKYGHPFSGENLFISPEGWRRCQICIAKSHGENRTMSEQQARRVVEALNEGKTIANITNGGSPSYILNHRALLLFRQSIRSSNDSSSVFRLQTRKFTTRRRQRDAPKSSGLRPSTHMEPISSCSFDLRSPPTCQHRSETT